MLRYILRKMISKKWLFIALLIGNILLTGIAASNPLYADAVMQRMLTDDMDAYLTKKNAYPGLVSVFFNGSVKKNGLIKENEALAHAVPADFGVPARMEVRRYFMSPMQNQPLIERDDAKISSIGLGALEDVAAHARIVAGRMFDSERRADGTVEVIVSQRALVELNLLMGERREFPKLTDADGQPIVIEVVGVYDVSDVEDPYWVRSPSSYKSECLLDFDLFNRLFVREDLPVALSGCWYELLDAERMSARNAQALYETALKYQEMGKNRQYLTVTVAFSDILKNHISQARRVRVTLWVLQAPIYILLAAFVFMVSRQILETEEAEISVLKSRGVSGGQILSMYLLQSCLLALAGTAAGVPLGALITQALGSANAFLEFVSRRALPVRVGRETALYALAAAAVSILAMVLPVRRYAKVSIVAQKQKKARRARPFWQKAFLDVIALGTALYGLYSFNGQKAQLAERILAGEVPDPLLFLCSSLFIIGAGLVAIRLIPLFVSAVFRVFRRLWSPALYASFLKVLRQRANQDFIMIFLVMTIALGVFNAQTARTINDSAEENTRYVTGADVVLREKWESNADQVAENPSLDLIYYEPDYGVYQTMEGAASVCKVFTDANVSCSVPGGTLKKTLLMAIDTDAFGRTAWFDESLLPHHINEYLNAMAQNARAVLVSANFRDEYGLKLGDVINYWNTDSESTRGIIYGFVDYWPGYAPFTHEKSADGVYRETENHLIVANLSQVQDVMGVRPYSVWVRAKDGAQFLYDYAETSGTRYAVFEDVDAKIVEMKNDPMIKSLNGVLTVGFIVALALCFIGFLMYWILSIRQRTLQFGIYRAMGMRMREILTMLLNEQLCISVLSIAVGAAVGHLAAKLYMPLIQIAYASSDSYLPLRTSVDVSDTLRLLVIVAVMLIACMAILFTIIRRMKIAQALKLGED